MRTGRPARVQAVLCFGEIAPVWVSEGGLEHAHGGNRPKLGIFILGRDTGLAGSAVATHPQPRRKLFARTWCGSRNYALKLFDADCFAEADDAAAARERSFRRDGGRKPRWAASVGPGRYFDVAGEI